MKRLVVLAPIFIAVNAYSQEVVSRTLDYDPERYKIIPDKVFEFGIPLLILFLILNTIVTILRNRAEHQLKMKMIDKGVSDDTLVKIFKESNAILKLQPLRWFIFSAAIAVACLTIHLLHSFLLGRSGYLPIAILLFFTSVAFLIYYRILQGKA